MTSRDFAVISAGSLRSSFAVIVSGTLLLTGCATTGPTQGGSGQWKIDNVVSRCLLSVTGGALVGAIVGAAAGGGSQRVGTGAAIGAGAGGVLCALMVSLDAQDKQRVRKAQIDAARTGSVQSSTYVGTDGRVRTIHVVPRPASPAASTPPAPQKSPGTAEKPAVASQPQPSGAEVAAEAGERICRSVPASITIEGSGTGQVDQIVCRTAEGDWLPA